MNYKSSIKNIYFKKRLEDADKRNEKLSKINIDL